MGVALTQHPEDYRAVVSLVGDYDALRLEAYPNGEYVTHEFGTVTNAAEFAWLNAYSPLQHVRPGAAASLSGRVTQHPIQPPAFAVAGL
jgi:prolyl oligopeptidase